MMKNPVYWSEGATLLAFSLLATASSPEEQAGEIQV
jgi:hypothetical protein